MIDLVLNKELLQNVLGQMDRAARVLEEERRGPKDPEPLSAEENDQLLADLGVAQAYASATTGQPEAVERSPASKEERTVYIPGSPELGNLQSAIEEYFLQHKQEAVEEVYVPRDDEDDRRAALDMAVITGERLKKAPKFDPERRLFGPFEQTDIRWINSLFAKGMRRFRGKHAFVARPARNEPIALPDENLRIILFGDWGSGIPRAKKVSSVIRQELDKGKQAGLQQHVVHVGDVYYSGWEFEYERRFLRDWPVHEDEKDTIGSFNLNGNHDMFSGGYAFYDGGLADERFTKWQGKSSLFYLANKRWQLFGLDTAWEDAALTGDQAQWILEAGDRGRKTVLLSHHQYCSSYEQASDGVRDRIRPVLGAFNIAAWFWGHEHRCMAYEQVDGIRFPRCVGHGGVPVYQNHGEADPVPQPGIWEYRGHYDSYEGWWAKFGIVTLDFHDDTITVRYLNEDGGLDRSETIS